MSFPTEKTNKAKLMSTDQEPTSSPEPEAPETEPQKRKPGFFSGLFSVTETTEPLEAPAEVEAEESKGRFGGFFGKKKKDKDADEPKKGWFQRLVDRLTKTRQGLIDSVRQILGFSGKLDEETIEELEAILLQSDVSIETTNRIVERMQEELKKQGSEGDSDELLNLFREAVKDILENSAPGFTPVKPENGPYVVMVVGVNGVGKTTTVGKMAKRCSDAGLKTMLVAADTFRAAAVEQLEVWADRANCDFMKGEANSDAAALCFDAMQAATARGHQVVFIDTAGRLHTKSGLMDELGKIERVIKKQMPDAPHETLLVIDATTGQNAIQQTQKFSETVDVSGLIMTKLDGTAKGGVLLSVLDMFKIPITLIGVGEGADDLRDFDPELYGRALFGEEGAEEESAG